MSAINHRPKFAVMTILSSRDIFTASKYRRLVPPVVIPLGIFLVFVTWYFWISLSCPVGSAIPSHICGTRHARVYPLNSWEGKRAAKFDHDNESQMLDDMKLVPVNDREQDVVEFQDTTGPGIIESEIPVIRVNSSDETFTSDFGLGVPFVHPKLLIISYCDLYHGEWHYDPAGPLYTNNSCPVLSQSQNCQGNGRPDKEYENWRWKPSQCELPRFNASKFFELMSGKTVTFVGDSVARNQMESLLCLLWQVEVPQNRGNLRMQRWYFRSHSVTVIRIWSAWLVHQATEPFSYIPEGITTIHLDIPDENIMGFVPKSDIIVLSNGHWYTKPSAYLLHNEIVGTQSWSLPPEQNPMNVTNMEAFRMTTETILTALVMDPNYSGLTILTSYSPDHYENGAWNSGGSCTGKVNPVPLGQLVENQYTTVMYEKQVMGFNKAVEKKTNQSKLKLMDITQAFGFRHDGHPGPYRNTNPNKVTIPGPNGRPPPQDCLHWCMPGPVDVWNELMLEIIRREFEK